jgi:hypothetical protein
MFSIEKNIENKNILEIIYEKTKNFFQIINKEKICKFCKEKVPHRSPRCISCWLNDNNYYLLIEKVIYTEKKNYFKNIYNSLIDKKNSNIPQLKCECFFYCKEIIKNGKKYLVCSKNKCKFFKSHPQNVLQELEIIINKINNINFTLDNIEIFPFSKSQKTSIISIYNSFFDLIENIENKKRCQYDNFFRLDGYAGTGKSTVIQSIFSLPEFRYFKICSCSNTHTAVEVSRNIYHNKLKNINKNELCIIDDNDMNIILNLIKENVLDISILSFIVKDNNYETLSGLLKEKPKYNSDGTITFNDNTITSVRREDIKNKSLYNIQKYDILIIDEYSMITEDKVEWFKAFGKYLKTFIVFVGDQEQIPPQISIKKIEDLNTKLLNINMKNICLKEIHRTRGDVTKLANLIRESKNIKEIRDNIKIFNVSEDIKNISGPMNINNFDCIHNSFNSDNYYQPKLLAYSNKRVHQINEIVSQRFINFDKFITYKPIKIYGKDYYSGDLYPIYLNINSIIKLINEPKTVNIIDIISEKNIKWENILDNCFQKIDELLKDKNDDLYIKIKKNDQILQMLLEENNEITDIIELEDIRCNNPKIFKNICYIINEIKELNNIKLFIKENITKKNNFIQIENDKILNKKFTEIKSIFENFVEKSRVRLYKCSEFSIDGGINIELKLRINDIRNVEKKNNTIEEITKQYPFTINVVKDKKEIANICNLKTKIKNKMDEITNIIKKKYKNNKPFVLIQEIIWENLYSIFDNLLIFSNSDENLKKYFNISEDVYISHPYSSTIHKAQGQTFSDVYIDVNNILNSSDHFIIKKRLLYTAVTRCSEKLYLNLGY